MVRLQVLSKIKDINEKKGHKFVERRNNNNQIGK